MNTLALGPSWLDPDYLLNTFGLPGLLLIVFAESGLLIGFFLPGDSLLFTTGLLVTTGDLKYPLWLVCVLVALAAIIGDQVGYLFGRKVGPALFKRPDSRLFKQENVEKAHEFFEKYGPKSLVLARFVPIVRTFTPIIAGVSRMNYRSFITFNIIGGVLWGVGVTLLGAALGKIDFVHQNIEMILILIVLISVVPIAIEFLRARSRSKKEAAQRGDDQGPSAGGPEAGPHGGANGENEGPAAYRHTAGQAAPYGGYDSRYGTTGGPGEYGGQGAPYGNGQPGPYGGAQDDQPGGAPYGGQYGAQQPGGQDAGYGAQYGTQQGGGQYGGTAQGGQYGGQYDGGAQYGTTQGARYGGAQQAGQYGGQQAGPYGAQQGGGQQYGGNQAGAPYDNGQAAPYGTGQAAPYAGGQPGPYDDGNSYGERPADGRGDAQEEDPGPYGWQNRR
ncbi:DedA family protein [Streptomyces sp. NPDC058377]|uniref:DedA family protein n=1 Tax=Streptomyces sp. NPDC058377 TaxID=3346468 RepID=UPI003666EABA